MNVLQADTIVVNCGLANFEQSCWSTLRRLHTGKDNDKFVRSLEDNYPGMCDGRSIRTIRGLRRAAESSV